jgi:hypothetical protein
VFACLVVFCHLGSPDNVEEALTLAAEAFLEDDTNFYIDEERKVATLSKIFSW